MHFRTRARSHNCHNAGTCTSAQEPGLTIAIMLARALPHKSHVSQLPQRWPMHYRRRARSHNSHNAGTCTSAQEPGLTLAIMLAHALPVSYTHLRAHETRHDIVCRLLLEKKKKKKT